MTLRYAHRTRFSVLVLVFALVAALTSSTGASAAPTDSAPARPSAVTPASTAPIAHDPTIVKEGKWWYVVITGDANSPHTFLPVKRSRDLVHWTELGPVFSTLPGWILPTLGLSTADAPKDLWAPDLSRVNGEWRLYYAISQFGHNNSVIGLATTKSLDPASKNFGWVDRGLVLQSQPATAPDPQEFNAIDPDATLDASGAAWLSFGSFWTGIKLRRLDRSTGKLAADDPALYDLATRPAPPDAVEGPSILQHGRYYYLFVAFDYCCRGADSDYRVVVGRSTSITGPYRDRAGVPMLRGGGTEVLRGYNEFAGTGGADTYHSGHTDYLVNHYYDATDAGTPKLNVRTLSWGGGWPAVSDPVTPSRSIGHGDAYVQIVPRGADTVVADPGCGYEGAVLTLAYDVGSPCQQWQVSDRGAGSRILNRFSNKVAEVAGCHNIDGGSVAQWGWLGYLPGGNDCQRWDFTATSDGYTAVSSVLTGHRVWDLAGGQAGVGTAIDITTPTPAGQEAQQYAFEPVGPVLLGSAADQTRTLGVSGCTLRRPRGDRVDTERRRGQACQTWTFERASTSSATYEVRLAADGRALTRPGCGDTAKGLRVVAATTANAGCRSWTLTPTDDGTWTLTGGGTVSTVRLLTP